MRLVLRAPALAGIVAAFAFAGCNAPQSASAEKVASITSGGTLTPDTKTGGCAGSGDPDQLCIGVKFVSYVENGATAVSGSQADDLIAAANQIWKQCKISFQIEEYHAVNPTDYGLTTSSNAQNESDDARKAFETDNQFLVVLTGLWNSNYVGWAELPGAGLYGAVMDGSWMLSAGVSGQITLAHELGHYLGLDHTASQSNLMYPQAYATALGLDASQCDSTRTTARNYWAAMLR